MATDVISNDPPQPFPVALQPAVDHLVTEDDIPVDDFFSEKQQRLLAEPLYNSRTAWGAERSIIAARMQTARRFPRVRNAPSDSPNNFGSLASNRPGSLSFG